MARSDTRYSVYPSSKAVEVVGNSSPSLNLAIECWGALLSRAMADNAHNFIAPYLEDVPPFREHCLHDWALLATVLRGIRFDPDFANPGELIATAVEDTHRLEKVGRVWFTREEFEWKDVDAAISQLAQKLRKELDYTHAWAIIVAVQWFWEHYEQGIDIKKDDWWTIAFRREWKAKQAPKGKGQSSEKKQGRRNTETAKRKLKQVGPSGGRTHE